MINENETKYLQLLKRVMDEGTDRPDRTGVGVRSLFGCQTKFDIRNGIFPLLTTKKINLASVTSELLWFIEGSGDERRLAELRFGKDRSELTGKQTIWTANADAPYWKPKAKYEGDLGRVYGVQWRHWRTIKEEKYNYGEDGEYSDVRLKITEVDQLADLINGIKSDPFGRRHILSAWNPGEMDKMALPPCHYAFQLYVSGDELSGMFQMRSTDVFLGLPFNIASYALLLAMIAQVCKLRVGDLIYSGGDCHIYHNHFDAVEEQLSRVPKAQPLLYMEPGINKIDEFKMDHFELINYNPYPMIKAPMAV